MAENFYTILTTAGLAAFANAQVSQEKVDFAKIAVGDSKGTYYNPVATATGLVNEVWSGPINSISLDEKNPNWIIVEAVIPATVGGFTVREIGVYNTAGILLAIGKVPETYKPAAEQGSLKDLYLRMILEVSNASAVTLKVDPAVIFASRKYVDEKFGILTSNIEAIASRIGDLNKLETDYKNDVVGAVNEVQQELKTLVESLGFHEPISEVLERGTNEINTPVKTLCSVIGLEGRTIINYAPLFDSGVWSVHANATVTAPNTLVFKPTAVLQQTRYNKIPLKAGNTYRLYYDIEGPDNKVYVNVAFSDVNDASLGYGQGNVTDQTFTVPALATRVDIFVTSEATSGTYTVKNIMLIEAQETKLPFVANMQGITNPTVENIRDNLIPAFHFGGDWYTPGWLKIGAIDAVNVNATSESGGYMRVLLPVVPGTKYTFACTRNAQVKVTTNKGSHIDRDQLTTLFEESDVQNGNMNCTFTVPADAYFIRILFAHPANGFVAYPRMVKGATSLPYKPQVREALTVKTTLHTGESLKVNAAGQLVKTKKYETIELGDVNARYIGIQTGLHLVDIALGLIGNDIPATLIKFNGAVCKQLNYTTGNSGNDTFYLDSRIATVDGGELRISIADTESGWGPSYQPTPAEIKAYFMGWKMYADGAGGRNELYETAKGNKYWYPISRVNDTFDSAYRTVNTAPTTFANNKASWQPYKLCYLLKTPVSEVVATAGSLTLDEGENMLVVSEGRIVREVTKPYHYKTTTPDGTVYNRYEINTRTQSSLAYNTANILQVYKNGKPDYAWRIEYVAIAGSVRALLEADLFDPAAVYTVTYQPLEPYRVSVPTNAITIEYADKLGGVIQLLVTTAAKLGTQTANMQNSPSFRFGYDEGGLYIAGKGDI